MSQSAGILRMSWQKDKPACRRLGPMRTQPFAEMVMNLLKDSVSNVLQLARPAEIHGVVLTGLIALTLALAGCGGGGGGGSAPSSSSSTDGSGGSGGSGTGGGSNGGSGGGGSTGNSAGPVVYLANQQDYQKYELFLADGAGGSVKLNGPLTTDANVNEFQLT